ncbi:hypothetical protein B0684_04985 [Thioalkalivibrio versutus]|nr:hypothetical protein B0684_04985 [Thioalkalivibrio versutus]
MRGMLTDWTRGASSRGCHGEGPPAPWHKSAKRVERPQAGPKGERSESSPSETTGALEPDASRASGDCFVAFGASQ